MGGLRQLIIAGWITYYFFGDAPVITAAIISSFIYKTFSTLRSIRTARFNHTATLLPDGKVLVAGGVEDFNSLPLNTSVIYDPSGDSGAGTWTEGPNMGTGRTEHTATLLPNGKVLVAGGRRLGGAFVGLLNTTEIYDPSAGTWTASDDMRSFRMNHTATLLPNGKVLVSGGFVGSQNIALDTSEIYDPSAGTWTTSGSMVLPRSFHTATLLPNGKVLVAGGSNDAAVLNTSEIYDPSAGTWTTSGSMVGGARRDHSATLLPNGKVLVVGGGSAGRPGQIVSGALNTSDIYDPSGNSGAGTWGAGPTMNGARFDHTATLLPNGKVLVAGGTTTARLNTSSLYDPDTDSWAAGPTMNSPRSQHTATLLPNGKVLVVGGGSAGSAGLNTSEIYNPDRSNTADSWAAGPTMNGERTQHTATLLPNGKVLVAGGTTNGSAGLNTSSLYDPVADSWAAVANPNNMGARFNHTATLLPNGKVLVAGGTTNGSAGLNTSSLYDPVLDSWAAVANPNNMGARFNHTATLLPNGKVLVAGGTTNGSAGLNTSSLYDPLADSWTVVSDLMNGVRSDHTATLLPNGKVLVAGGFGGGVDLNTSDIYDPSGNSGAGSWTSVDDTMNGVRSDHTATLLPNGKVLVAGGSDDSAALSTSDIYDPSDGSWTVGPTMNGVRSDHKATLLPNGKVLVAGGTTNGSAGLNTSSLYDPVLDSWAAVANPNNMGARFNHTATLLPNGKVLAAGGSAADGGVVNTSSLYDPNVYSVVVFPVFSNGTGTINGTTVTTGVEFEIKDPGLTQTLIFTSATGNVAQLTAS